MMKKTILSLLLGTAWILNGCDDKMTSTPTPQPAAASVTATETSNLPSILVGTEFGYMPFEFQDAKGEADGFEMELLRAIAKAEGFKVQVINTPFRAGVEQLNAGAYQIWASSVGINLDYQTQILFSHPTLDFQPAIMVMDKSDIQSLADLAGKKIAINKGSLGNANFVKEIKGEAVGADSFYGSLKLFYSGNTDAVVGNDRIFQYYQTQFKDKPTRILPLNIEKQYFGFAVKKGNEELLGKLNAGLDKVKKDGTFDQLVTKYFGTQATASAAK